MNKTKYIYNIGEVIKTKTGKIIILEQIRVKNGKGTRKGYLYKCLIDGNMNEISEGDLKTYHGCNVCSGRKVLKGCNDIATTHPFLVKYFKNKDDAYMYNHGSENKVVLKCPYCQNEKETIISNLCKRGFKCECFSSKSIGEMTMFNVLTQLNIDFKKEITFNWSKNIQVDNPKLSGNKRYDFYFELNNEKYIIETHGMQHYKGGFERIRSPKARNKKEEVINDNIKKHLALDNDIKEENYVVIDCRYTDFLFIKNNILNSRLSKLFDLSKIDWNKCLSTINKNEIKEISDIWNDGKDIEQISNMFKINRNTIRDKLKIGATLGFNNYDVEEEISKRIEKSIKIMTDRKKKKVQCLNNGMVFDSISELVDKSRELFGVLFIQSSISAVCKGKQKQHKGYTFKYI